MGLMLMAKATGPHLVECYLCGHRFEVGARTMSTNCPGCNKPVIVEDVVVKGYKPVKRLQTCGRLVIQRGGRVVAERIEAHKGIECNGALHGEALSGGPVLLGAKAEWKGDCRAPVLRIKKGAVILAGRFCVPEDPLQLSDLHEQNARRLTEP